MAAADQGTDTSEEAVPADTGDVPTVAPKRVDRAVLMFLSFLWLVVAGFGGFLFWWADDLTSHAVSVPTVLYALVVIGLLRITGRFTS